MRMRRKKNLIPRMERCAAFQVKEPETMRGRWRTLYPEAEEVWIEIGCGKGTFTAETARRNPNILLIAVERVADAMVMAMEKAAALELGNVFFLCADAAKLGEIFAPGEADRIFLNFSDPWPSKRHCRRRLTHAGFLLSYREVLRDGGQIHLKTDNRPLFDFSLTQFPAAGYTLSEVTNDLHANGVQSVMTDYEAKFYAEGVPINRCVATKGALPDPFVLPEDVSLIPFGYVEGTKYGR
ncbi:MAG: tRNA (guanosine(46)-N7)-methyltransferase TrmB [Oscillospiraceae bacterium]|nr:tRNA (guanosine(46)-N7)-methyltransferase TrmB [Oscillospiraceae bacterium]